MRQQNALCSRVSDLEEEHGRPGSLSGNGRARCAYCAGGEISTIALSLLVPSPGGQRTRRASERPKGCSSSARVMTNCTGGRALLSVSKAQADPRTARNKVWVKTSSAKPKKVACSGVRSVSALHLP